MDRQEVDLGVNEGAGLPVPDGLAKNPVYVADWVESGTSQIDGKTPVSIIITKLHVDKPIDHATLPWWRTKAAKMFSSPIRLALAMTMFLGASQMLLSQSSPDAHAQSGYEQSIQSLKDRPLASNNPINWTNGAPLPCREASMAVTRASNNHIFLFGGEGFHGASCGTNSTFMANNFEYASDTNSWIQNPDVPYISRYAAAAEDGMGNVYITGGQDNVHFSDGLDTVMIYNIYSHTYTTSIPMPNRRIGGGAQFVKNELYVYGGANGTGVLNKTDIFSPTTGLWRSGPDMNFASVYFGTVVKDGNIYVIAGNNGSGEIPNVEYLNPISESWFNVQNITTASYQLSAAVLNSEIEAIGGDQKSTGTTLDLVQTYTGSWAMNTNFPFVITGAGAASNLQQNRIYVFGGWNSEGMYTNNTSIGNEDPATPTPTSTSTPTSSPTFASSPTATRTATASATAVVSASATAQPSATPSSTEVSHVNPTATFTATSTPFSRRPGDVGPNAVFIANAYNSYSGN